MSVADERLTTEGPVYTVTGADWDQVLGDVDGDRLTVNLGPQHPSSHGVLRLVLDLDGETVTDTRAVVGYLHTGIEKNCEYRTWTQGVPFLTRADYLAPFSAETAYCLAVEQLLGARVPARATTIRVLMMELNRISSHIAWLAATGMELGATTVAADGFADRDRVLDVFELVTGLRMNPAYIRPGGVAADLPAEAPAAIRRLLTHLRERVDFYHGLLSGQPVFAGRMKDVGVIDVSGCVALGVTGPVLRAAGLPWDLRVNQSYCGYETYDFEVPTRTEGDSFARYLVRMDEILQSCRIVEQALDRLEPGPVMVEDAKIAWPAQLALGQDGLGNSLDHVRHIMGQSMEALIHHFKLVTEGFRVPAGQAYVEVEAPRGQLGCHVVSDGGTRPARVHLREPSFVNLQAVGPLVDGGSLGEAIVAVGSLDPVMGGCDR